VAVRTGPPVVLPRPWAEAGLDVGEFGPIRGHADVADGGGIGDGVEREVVALVVELKRDHPVDQFRDRRLGPRCDRGVQVQQRPARVADDPAGVVGAHDHLQCRGDRLLRHRDDDGGIVGLSRLPEDRHGFVHLSPVLVCRAPAPQVGTCPDQRQDRIAKVAHSVNDSRSTRRPPYQVATSMRPMKSLAQSTAAATSGKTLRPVAASS
jgi:hypothetical protein